MVLAGITFVIGLVVGWNFFPQPAPVAAFIKMIVSKITGK